MMRTVWTKVEGLCTAPVELTTVAARSVTGEIRDRSAGIAAMSGDPVTDTWTDGDDTWVRHASGVHRAYWSAPAVG